MKIRIAVPVSMLALGLATVAVPLAVGAQDAEVPAYLEVRDVLHGTVDEVSYRSTALETDREVVVYTPPGYEASSDRYPVLSRCGSGTCMRPPRNSSEGETHFSILKREDSR